MRQIIADRLFVAFVHPRVRLNSRQRDATTGIDYKNLGQQVQTIFPVMLIKHSQAHAHTDCITFAQVIRVIFYNARLDLFMQGW